MGETLRVKVTRFGPSSVRYSGLPDRPTQGLRIKGERVLMNRWDCQTARHRWNELWDKYTQDWVKDWPLFTTENDRLLATDTCGACGTKRYRSFDPISFAPNGRPRYEAA